MLIVVYIVLGTYEFANRVGGASRMLSFLLTMFIFLCCLFVVIYFFIILYYITHKHKRGAIKTPTGSFSGVAQ